ncbi:flavoprotein [Carbonactinospora thermoautotrophica]|uniref:Flavoprotein n=1 Tax=Carbonactinospora thermoautotrophica TaxID=1469144 RepID=A0A132N218_9ACTN|nr:flavoprotein [Carbonactinospora thermoautotrophica]KWX04134.1 flavoprotein [Carbonactinospora thermoautotrophica]KWX06632.1 flavoprotein [Carbonactinospora thermoautotrophica]
MSRVLIVIPCAAGPAPRVGKLVEQAQARGWDVHLIPTPAALDFLDVPALEARIGRPIRARYRKPGEPKTTPDRADAVIVAPATFNTLSKWAHGITDTYALGVIAESMGQGVPMAALPFLSPGLAGHPLLEQNLATLRRFGVTVLWGPDVYLTPPEEDGGQRLEAFPWHLALDAVEQG